MMIESMLSKLSLVPSPRLQSGRPGLAHPMMREQLKHVKHKKNSTAFRAQVLEIVTANVTKADIVLLFTKVLVLGGAGIMLMAVSLSMPAAGLSSHAWAKLQTCRSSMHFQTCPVSLISDAPVAGMDLNVSPQLLATIHSEELDVESLLSSDLC